MSTRTAVVILSVVGLVVLAVIVLGARSGSPGNSQSRSSLVDRLGDLATGRQVVDSDLVGSPCPGTSAGTLRVISQCSDPLPGEAKKLRLCVVSGSPEFVGIKGARYPLQQADLSRSACPAGSVAGSSAASSPVTQHDGAHFDLYDSQNSLIVVCPALAVCVLRLDD